MRAKNPEQEANNGLNLTNAPAYNNNWSLGYSYDGNGNLSSRTDARGVVSSYGYDALNRNITTSYNDSLTPALERHYDTLSNGKGRLSYHLNYTLNPATGTAGSSRLVTGAYDALGRVTSQAQGFLHNNGSTWVDFTAARTYDLAGHTLTQSYPSGRSVSYSYGAGGRLSSASGNLGGTSYTYADNVRQQLFAVRVGTSGSTSYDGNPTSNYLGDEPSWDRGMLVWHSSTNEMNGAAWGRRLRQQRKLRRKPPEIQG